MKGIEFKIHGKMAHFRKYYSNSTALSYHIPPVTTVKGIIAGLIGYERDSYYEVFSNDKCSIAIAVEHPLKKITQTVNLLKVEKVSDLCGTGVHSQNHTEWIVPENIREGDICYRIMFWHSDSDLVMRLGKCIVHPEPGYFSNAIALSLGSAQCQGWISDGRYREFDECISRENEEIISNFSAPVSILKQVQPYSGGFKIKKEECITDFDQERFLRENSKKDIIVPADGKPVKYILKENISYKRIENGEAILFIAD